jgi:hypothetical protein
VDKSNQFRTKQPSTRGGRIYDISREGIGSFQSALADGPHTELYRLEQLCSSWSIDLTGKAVAERQALAAAFEVEYYKVASDQVKEDPDYLLSITDAHKFQCCAAL